MGLVNPQYVEIRSGLQEGAMVIYAGFEALREGDPVVATEWGPSGPMNLPPATGEPPKGTFYTCPMHPNVKSEKPGECPECGMKLQPKEPAGGPPGGEKMPGM